MMESSSSTASRLHHEEALNGTDTSRHLDQAMAENGVIAAMEPQQNGSHARQLHATVVFLTLNDVYELLPNADGQGGVAEFATLLERTRDAISTNYPDTTIIVTLNGDFLWRSELDRTDKGPLMMRVLQCLGIDYVVVGNHEFDHSAMYLKELLQTATFKSFGSNVRETADGTLMRGLTDTELLPLSSGLRLGMFGVSTTETAADPFVGADVKFEDPFAHARRCVAHLQAQGADVIVALTHLKMKEDKQLARHVPGISIMLGGHDHEPTTEFVGNTMIHKSGQNALWLGNIRLTITKTERSAQEDDDQDPMIRATTSVEYEWQMLYNRGYPPHPETHAVVQAYLQSVEADDAAKGKLVPLARSRTALDGSRATCRQRECSVGYLVADALRVVLDADVSFVHAGLIKGDKLNPPGLVITQRWLEKTLPQPKPTVVVEIPARTLKDALQHLLRRLPCSSSSTPHISGARIVYELPDAVSTAGRLTSLRLTSEPDTELAHSDRMLRVAMAIVPSMDGWQQFFAQPVSETLPLRHGPIVRDVVALYLTRHVPAAEVAYERNEQRMCMFDR